MRQMPGRMRRVWGACGRPPPHGRGPRRRTTLPYGSRAGMRGLRWPRHPLPAGTRRTSEPGPWDGTAEWRNRARKRRSRPKVGVEAHLRARAAFRDAAEQAQRSAAEWIWRPGRMRGPEMQSSGRRCAGRTTCRSRPGRPRPSGHRWPTSTWAPPKRRSASGRNARTGGRTAAHIRATGPNGSTSRPACSPMQSTAGQSGRARPKGPARRPGRRPTTCGSVRNRPEGSRWRPGCTATFRRARRGPQGRRGPP